MEVSSRRTAPWRTTPRRTQYGARDSQPATIRDPERVQWLIATKRQLPWFLTFDLWLLAEGAGSWPFAKRLRSPHQPLPMPGIRQAWALMDHCRHARHRHWQFSGNGKLKTENRLRWCLDEEYRPWRPRHERIRRPILSSHRWLDQKYLLWLSTSLNIEGLHSEYHQTPSVSLLYFH